MAMGDTHLHLRKFLNKTERQKKTLGTWWFFFLKEIKNTHGNNMISIFKN